ncbi:MAG TPA: DUF6587 family protein [Noviherbaspirillum sp.]|jgi:hypothetical protein
MMQEAVVGLIVIFACWTVAKRYLPKAMRQAIRSWSVRSAERAGWHRLAAWLSKEKQGGSCADGCGSCGGCGSDTPAPPSKDDGRFVIKLTVVK